MLGQNYSLITNEIDRESKKIGIACTWELVIHVLHVQPGHNFL